MNPSEDGAGTGGSEQTAPKQEQSLSEEILSLMRGEEPAAPATTEEVPQEVPTTTEEEIPQQTEETELEPEAAPVEGAWPQSAKKRVAEETEKRKKWQAAADKQTTEVLLWKERAEQNAQRAQELERQLSESSGPRPTPGDPLSDVFDMPSLKKAEAHYTNIKDVMTQALDENPTLDELEIVVGKTKDGEPQTELISRKKAVEYRRTAEHALQKLIPAREKVLVERERGDALAMKVYPQFSENKGDNEWTGFVRETLALIPGLQQVPDIAIWLGHALEGRRITLERLQKQYGKNGDIAPGAPGAPGTAKEIISAASRPFKAAPAVSTGRVPSQSTPRRGADVEGAKKRMQANPGSDDAMADFIDAKLFRSPSRGYTKV